jgi:RHS repeat-associated protein
MINAGAVRVPEGAGFNPGLEITVAPQLTQFQNAITTHQAGYVYVWVSNESENTKVWFDDLKVTHRSSRVTQATDYYAWGNVMRENKSPEDVRYRYGYQGQFAEKDEETGWNHFELREYDAVIGRWLVIDPYRQFWSPYIGQGNNPINNNDPDSGMTDPVFGDTKTVDGRNFMFTGSDWAELLDAVTVNDYRWLGGTVLDMATSIWKRNGLNHSTYGNINFSGRYRPTFNPFSGFDGAGVGLTPPLLVFFTSKQIDLITAPCLFELHFV